MIHFLLCICGQPHFANYLPLYSQTGANEETGNSALLGLLLYSFMILFFPLFVYFAAKQVSIEFKLDFGLDLEHCINSLLNLKD